jgi:hypothetical protein
MVCNIDAFSLHNLLSMFDTENEASSQKHIILLLLIYLPLLLCSLVANKHNCLEEDFFPLQLLPEAYLPLYACNVIVMRNKSVYNISGHIIKVDTEHPQLTSQEYSLFILSGDVLMKQWWDISSL